MAAVATITHPATSFTYTGQPELGTEIVMFEVKMVKLTAPPSPAPAPTGALTHFHPTSNKSSPKGASICRVTFWSHFQHSWHSKELEAPFFLLKLCFEKKTWDCHTIAFTRKSCSFSSAISRAGNDKRSQVCNTDIGTKETAQVPFPPFPHCCSHRVSLS